MGKDAGDDLVVVLTGGAVIHGAILLFMIRILAAKAMASFGGGGSGRGWVPDFVGEHIQVCEEAIEMKES